MKTTMKEIAKEGKETYFKANKGSCYHFCFDECYKAMLIWSPDAMSYYGEDSYWYFNDVETISKEEYNKYARRW